MRGPEKLSGEEQGVMLLGMTLALLLHLALFAYVFMQKNTLPVQSINKILPDNKSVVEPAAPITDEPLSNEHAPSSDLEEEAQTTISILQSEDSGDGSGEAFPETTHIPSRWALKPPLSEQRLSGLGFSQKDIECLTSLEEDCTELRKSVFAEYQLSEMELVWTPNRADIGMPARFRGMTDQQIMEELGFNYAGGNAFMILPGITIDGPLWDKLHGVNKTCRLVPGIEPSTQVAGGFDRPGGMGAKRDCD